MVRGEHDLYRREHCKGESVFDTWSVFIR